MRPMQDDTNALLLQVQTANHSQPAFGEQNSEIGDPFWIGG